MIIKKDAFLGKLLENILNKNQDVINWKYAYKERYGINFHGEYKGAIMELYLPNYDLTDYSIRVFNIKGCVIPTSVLYSEIAELTTVNLCEGICDLVEG